MKNFLYTVCLLLVAFQFVSAQKNATIRIGIHLQPNCITSDNPHYKMSMHKGLFIEVDKGKLWTPTYTISHYLGKFQSKEPGLNLADPIAANQGVSPGNSILTNNVKEHGLDFAAVFNRKIKIKGLNPFIGLGFNLQMPLTASGERYITNPSGTTEQISDPSVNLGIINPGLVLQIGSYAQLNDRLGVVVLLGSKSNYIPNASSINNTLTQVRKSIPVYQSFFAQLGISYTFQDKKEVEVHIN